MSTVLVSLPDPESTAHSDNTALISGVHTVVVVSDIHAGCQLGLCPESGVSFDSGATYHPGPLQRQLWSAWNYFWQKWVPVAAKAEQFAVVVNGDALDGRHHNTTTQSSQNLADQISIAYEILAPIRDLCENRLYVVRGTEAHVGPTAEMEELLGQRLNAIPDVLGNRSRFDLWLRINDRLVHFAHHVGTCGSAHYESTAIMKELTESYTEAARWRLDPPDIVVRSHRHRHLEVRVSTKSGYGISFCTAGWQLKTPYTYRTAGGRISTPQIGGSLIRLGDQDLYTRHKVWGIERSAEEVLK